MKTIYSFLCNAVSRSLLVIAIIMAVSATNIFGQQTISLDLAIQATNRIPSTKIKKGENLGHLQTSVA